MFEYDLGRLMEGVWRDLGNAGRAGVDLMIIAPDGTFTESRWQRRSIACRDYSPVVGE